MNSEQSSEQSAQWIAEALVADSMIELDERRFEELVDALEEDGPPYPTRIEANILVMGDEEGQLPENAIALYPRTHRFLDSLF